LRRFLWIAKKEWIAMRTTLFLAVAMGVTCAAFAEFTIEDDGKALTVLDNGAKVLAYNYALVEPPKGVPERYRRSCYIHPLYSLDGEVISQDFPLDHFHHRGLHWTWPCCKVGERDMDIWTIVGCHQLFQEWIAREASGTKAEIAVKNGWYFDDLPNDPKVEETVRFTVLPATDTGRCIDFDLTFKNVSAEKVVIRGQLDGNKGYGGFLFRPDAAFKPFTFTSALGVHEKDELKAETPWADCTWKSGPDAPVTGLAIFQHPANPGYPHPGWIFRHYAFLGTSWPHLEGYDLEPGASVELRYRVYIHRGGADEAHVADAFKTYTESAQK
jgi:hypothetical protein